MDMIFDKEMVIDDRIVSGFSPVFIIAEAGVNHNGDIGLAKKMIDAAIDAGVDAVKFQTYKTDRLILKDVEKAPYQKKNSVSEETQYEMLKRFEISKDQIMDLMEYCKDKNIIFLSTPYDKESLDELDEMGIAAYKIAATDITNIQFLEQVALKGKPILLSAGMCYMEEVKKALETIHEINSQVILLQCTSNYPIQDEEVNLKVIKSFQKQFDMLVGYSDHSQGVGAAPYAAALGAKVIEKHFTLDKQFSGPDHKASVTPDELKRLVQEVRRVEKYLGNGVKMPTYSEQLTRRALQKCLVAARSIKIGEKFSEDNIVAKRTNGNGISALYYDSVLNLKAGRNYEPDDIIKLE